MEKQRIIIPILVSLLSVNILFANNLIPAYATSFNNVTLPSGSIAQDSEFYTGSANSNRLFYTATNGGSLWLYTKGHNVYTASQSIGLNGLGGQMAYDTSRNYLWIFTTAGIYRFSGASSSIVDFTSSATYNGVSDAVYDSVRDRVYAVDITGTVGIYDIDASNPSSVTTWTNTNMGGYNLLGSVSWDLALDAEDGKLFFNVASGASGETAVQITNLSGTWNQTRTIGNLGAGVTPYGIDVDIEFNYLAVTISDGSAVRKYDTSVTGNVNMTLLATISTGTIPRYITVVSDTHKAYVGRSSGNAVETLDLSGNALQASNATCTNPIGHLSSKYVNSANPTTYVSIVCQTNNTNTLMIDTAGQSTGGNFVNGLDCSLPENEHKLVCAISTGNQYSLPQQLLNQSANTLYCQTGIVACTDNGNGGFTPVDSNPQTNGLGYILAIVGLGIMIGIFWVASDGQLTNVPTFIWFIGTIAVLGALTGFGYLDPTFLIVGIFAIIGFAVAKAKGIFSGGSIFAGETA